MNNTNLQDVPLDQIVPNPDQPRRYISPESIQSMADSLKEIGQQTPIKVVKVSPQSTVDSPQETLSGNTQYMIVGGHRRWEGAKVAGLTSLKAIVQDLTPDQADLAAFMDNQSEEMTWLDTDLAIARRLKTTNLDQRALAKQLGVSKTTIANAYKVAGALTPTSIDIIGQNLQKTLLFDGQSLTTKNKGFLISENHVLTLATLDDPSKVEQALKVAMDELMTEPETKKLVEWVKAGNTPESYESAKVRKFEGGKDLKPAPSSAGGAEGDFKPASVQPNPSTPVEHPQQTHNQAGRNLLKWVWSETRQAFINGLKGMGRKAITASVIFLVVVVVYTVLGWGSNLFYHLIRPQAYWNPIPTPIAEATVASTSNSTPVMTPLVDVSSVAVAPEASAPTLVAMSAPTPIATPSVDMSEAPSKPEVVKDEPAKKKHAKVVEKTQASTPAPKKSEDIVGQAAATIVNEAAKDAVDGLAKNLGF